MMGHLKLAPQWLKHLLTAQMPGVWCEHEGQGPEPVKWTLFRTQVIRRFLQTEAWQQRVTWGWGCCWNVLLTLRSLFSLTRGGCWQLFWYGPDTKLIWTKWGNCICCKVIESHWKQQTLVPWLLAMPAGFSPFGSGGYRTWATSGLCNQISLPRVFTPLPCHPGPWRENN